MIKTDRFKTVLVELLFRKPIKKEEITINNFLIDALTYTSNKYKTRREMIIKEQDLYGANIGFNCYRMGNYYTADIYLNLLDEKYSEKNILDEAFTFLVDTIKNPNVKNGEFDVDTFEIVKKNLEIQLDRIKESGDRFSIVRLFDNMAKDKVLSYHSFGYREDLEQITRASLFEHYNKFFQESILDVFIIGDIDFEKTEQLVRKSLDIETETDSDVPLIVVNDKKIEEKLIVEKDGSEQGKLSIGCYVDSPDEFERDYVSVLYNIILGSGTDSKFFKNIREKHSICYYASSSFSKSDNTLVITSGISPDNLDKMVSLIKKEMNDMTEGNFTEEDIEKAKKAYITGLEEVYDYQSQMISYYFSSHILGSKLPDERKKEITKVTKEDIMEFSKKVHIDTIYMLGGK